MRFLPLLALGLAACADMHGFKTPSVQRDPMTGAKTCAMGGYLMTVTGRETDSGPVYEMRPAGAVALGTPVVIEVDGRPIGSGIDSVTITPEMRAAIDAGERLGVTRTETTGKTWTFDQSLDDFVWCLG